MSRYDAIIFDLDGTLLDTLDDLRDAVNHALAEMGWPLRSREDREALLAVLASAAAPENEVSLRAYRESLPHL